MAEVLIQPQFQVLTHQQTGVQTGRIYFPAVFLAEYHLFVKNGYRHKRFCLKNGISSFTEMVHSVFTSSPILQKSNTYN
jgi:hypothetical protein